MVGHVRGAGASGHARHMCCIIGHVFHALLHVFVAARGAPAETRGTVVHWYHAAAQQFSRTANAESACCGDSRNTCGVVWCIGCSAIWLGQLSERTYSAIATHVLNLGTSLSHGFCQKRLIFVALLQFREFLRRSHVYSRMCVMSLWISHLNLDRCRESDCICHSIVHDPKLHCELSSCGILCSTIRLYALSEIILDSFEQ